jgi:copper chaperone CopZ
MHCVKSITDALHALDGVSDVRVELETKTVSFNGDAEKVKAIIEDLGFDTE